MSNQQYEMFRVPAPAGVRVGATLYLYSPSEDAHVVITLEGGKEVPTVATLQEGVDIMVKAMNADLEITDARPMTDAEIAAYEAEKGDDDDE